MDLFHFGLLHPDPLYTETDPLFPETDQTIRMIRIKIKRSRNNAVSSLEKVVHKAFKIFTKLFEKIIIQEMALAISV